MIGLIDYDMLVSRKKLHLPNLEVMKVGAFYARKKRETVRLIESLDENLSAFKQVFFFSNFQSVEKIPKEILSCTNIIYIGDTFVRGDYMPLSPVEIEYVRPDVGIYKPLLRRWMEEKRINEDDVMRFLFGNYVRLQVSGKSIILPPFESNKPVYIYDKNMLFYGWQSKFKEISSQISSSIKTVHPMMCRNMTVFLEIKGIRKISPSNEIVFNFHIPLDEIKEYMKKFKNPLLRHINNSSNVFLLIGKNFQAEYYDNDFFARNIYEILNLLYAFWANGIPIKIKKYTEHPLNIVNPYETVLDNIEKWTRIDDPSTMLGERIKFKEHLSQLEALLKRRPEIFKLLLQSKSNLMKQGEWKICKEILPCQSETSMTKLLGYIDLLKST